MKEVTVEQSVGDVTICVEETVITEDGTFI
jgi:hypothetical protein